MRIAHVASTSVACSGSYTRDVAVMTLHNYMLGRLLVCLAVGVFG